MFSPIIGEKKKFPTGRGGPTGRKNKKGGTNGYPGTKISGLKETLKKKKRQWQQERRIGETG